MEHGQFEYLVPIEELKRIEKSEDALSFVIKAHLYAESILNASLEHGVPRPDHLDVDRLGFSQKMRFCLALGVFQEDMTTGLREINRIRNRYAHNIDANISDDEISRIIGKFPDLVFHNKKSDERRPVPIKKFQNLVIRYLVFLDAMRFHFKSRQDEKIKANENLLGAVKNLEDLMKTRGLSLDDFNEKHVSVVIRAKHHPLEE